MTAFQLRVITIVVIVLVAFGLGYGLRGCGRTPSTSTTSHAHDGETVAPKAEIWTCSMHPQVRQPGPGRCPLCGMELIPVVEDTGAEELGPRDIHLSDYAIKLAEIETALVERRAVTADVRLVGKVDYDETRLGTITARFPGRLDRLFVDYTGIPVAKGEHLASIYSPELLTAQEELLQAVRSVRNLEASGATDALSSARRLLDAVREKLRLWDLTDEQIAEIEQRGTPSDHTTIFAPLGGIVIRKDAVEGTYVQTGMPIYTIADLTRVWVKLDAYESDLAWIRLGQSVTFTTEAYPGDTFTGRVAFIDPMLDGKTRTVKVRVNVENADGRLKPGLFVHGVLSADLAADGRVINRELAGKWMCSMHPEVIKDTVGACDECGMPLVRAETLGYVSDADTAGMPLVIPASAPLLTGTRAVVYVAVPDKPGTYEGREIVLGPRAGNWYLVRDGLTEGESVVVNGAFKIDSAIQILAKPSMMQPAVGQPPVQEHGDGQMTMDAPTPATSAIPDEFRTQLDAVYTAYFTVQQGLSHDTLETAKTGAAALLQALGHVDMTLLSGQAHLAWMRDLDALRTSTADLAAADTIAHAREAFALLSEAVYAFAARFGSSGTQPILRFHCPMAFDNRGADWLQNISGVENPYFGAQMFQCGEQVEVVTPGPTSGAHGHDE